jgi:hypothetical protein
VCPRAEDHQREGVPGESLPELGRRRKAWKPQKGMFRLRERNAAPGGRNAGAHPGGDSHGPEGLAPRAFGRPKGPKRRSGDVTRDVAPGVGQDPRGDKSSGGDRPQTSSNRGLAAVRIHCWRKALKAANGLRKF